MADPARRAKLVRDLEQDFVPEYDAQNMPSGDKRAAYALEHIAFRVGRTSRAWRGMPPRSSSAATSRPAAPHGGRPSHFVPGIFISTSSNGL